MSLARLFWLVLTKVKVWWRLSWSLASLSKLVRCWARLDNAVKTTFAWAVVCIVHCCFSASHKQATTCWTCCCKFWALFSWYWMLWICWAKVCWSLRTWLSVVNWSSIACFSFLNWVKASKTCFSISWADCSKLIEICKFEHCCANSFCWISNFSTLFWMLFLSWSSSDCALVACCCAICQRWKFSCSFWMACCSCCCCNSNKAFETCDSSFL